MKVELYSLPTIPGNGIAVVNKCGSARTFLAALIMSGLPNSLRRRGVVAAFVSPGEGDRDDLPGAIDADELEGVHAAVAEAIAHVKLVGRPKGG